MMNRKLFVFSILLLSIFALALWSPSFATPIPINIGDEIKISGQAPYATISGGRGGPYTASSPKDAWENFLTFCLEIDEYLNFSSTFIAGNISTATDNGGKNTNVGDPLSYFTAYLYTKAVSGAFNKDQLDDVQYAIWYEEEEIAWNSLPQAAQSFFNQEKYNYAISNWSGLGNVRVINLIDASGALRQDLLVTAPVPEPASMLLFGTGLVVFGIARKFKKI